MECEMSDFNIKALDKSIHTSNLWLEQVMENLHLKQKEDAYHLLRGALHLIRDTLPNEEAVDFANDLPLVIKGIFYDDWDFKKLSINLENKEGAIVKFKEKVGKKLDINYTEALQSVLKVLHYRMMKTIKESNKKYKKDTYIYDKLSKLIEE
jgi:uncharacterized protein (DUF2267 family)